MKIQGTINLDVRDISTTYDYGRVTLNAGNKQVSIQLTEEAAEQLQIELLGVLPDTQVTKAFKYHMRDSLKEGSEDWNTLFNHLKEQGLLPKESSPERATSEEKKIVNDIIEISNRKIYSDLYKEEEENKKQNITRK